MAKSELSRLQVVIRSCGNASLPDVEYDAMRIAQVTAWYGCFLFLEGAASGAKSLPGCLHVGYEKLEHGPMFLALLDVQAKGACLETQQ